MHAMRDRQHGEDLSELYRAERGRLFGIAYRMLGSVTEAEDLVQEAFARYGKLDPAAVREPQAFLTTVVTRLAIDHLKSARTQREHYTGSWLPEPLVADEPGVAEQVEIADSISMAFLVLLESLSPVERAVFLLREAFEYDYDAIAPIVDRTPEHCRQIALRARRQVDARRPRFEASRSERDDLARRFFAACHDGDAESLLELLSADSVLYGDGGGRAPAAREPVHGRDRVMRVVVALAQTAGRVGARYELVTVNGQPGARYLAPDGKLINVVALDIADGEVQAVRSVVNPDKLQHLGPTADIPELIARAARRGTDRPAPEEA
jgi:RNA polymerase sigma-70 factor (ECF subfamily)